MTFKCTQSQPSACGQAHGRQGLCQTCPHGPTAAPLGPTAKPWLFCAWSHITFYPDTHFPVLAECVIQTECDLTPDLQWNPNPTGMFAWFYVSVQSSVQNMSIDSFTMVPKPS
ncbi:hypothetical protein KIL84_015402 [Mauremys mutica]|uniref:Uncharacterized protein n=1 Tax=Mauremys mutica TaxID=74926 RepID=A0A9D4ARZ6_9SAUR|nr:hypothetical protein KIL84_015402 [Mauremys mutica]